MTSWDYPALFFLDVLWRWFIVLFVVYYIIRASVGHGVHMVRYLLSK